MHHSPLVFSSKRCVNSGNGLEPNWGTRELIICYAAGMNGGFGEMTAKFKGGSWQPSSYRLSSSPVGFSNNKSMNSEVCGGNQITPKRFQHCPFFRHYSAWVCGKNQHIFPRCTSRAERGRAVWLVEDLSNTLQYGGGEGRCVPEVTETVGAEPVTLNTQVAGDWDSLLSVGSQFWMHLLV